MAVKHHYYVIPGVVDLGEVRKKAHRALNEKLEKNREESDIHAHKQNEPCNENCEGLRFSSEVPIALMTPEAGTGVDPSGIR